MAFCLPSFVNIFFFCMGNNSFCLIQMIACVFFAYQIEAYDLLIYIDNLSFRYKRQELWNNFINLLEIHIILTY